MSLRMMCLAAVLAGFLTGASVALSDEQFDNIASDQEKGYFYRAQMGPGWNGPPTHPPYGAPGGDRIRGMRVGAPYYWSATGAPGPGANAGPPGMGYGQPMYGGGFANGGWGYGANYGMGGGPAGNPYEYHFGPGFHRHSNYGHYRFPYYSYRAPWYSPGPAGYNRDTNFPW